MASQIVDLDVLMPENTIVGFTAGKGENKKRYEIEMFIPAGAGFTIIENLEIIRDMFPAPGTIIPRLKKESIELSIRLMSDVCKPQYPEITPDWIEKNLSLPKQMYLLYRLVLPVYEFLTNSGLLEAAMPVKNP